MPNLPVRERADAKLAGVCAALARAWAIDPLIIRVAFVVLGVLTNGFIVAAYLALWALLPERGGDAPLHQLFPATRSWSWPALVTVVVLVATTVGVVVSGSGPGAILVLGLAWVILRFGFAGRRKPTSPAPPPPPPPPTTPFQRAARAWQLRLDNLQYGRPADWEPEVAVAASLYAPEPHVAAPLPPKAPASRRRGARTWLGILVGLGATWAGLATASALGVVVPPLAWLSGTLLVLGLALVWSARPARAVFGRPALLLPLAVLLSLSTVPLLFPASAQVPSPPEFAAPKAMAEDGVTRLPIGEHVLDLADLPPATETLRYRLDLGDLRVQVPREGNVVVNAAVNLGDVKMPDGDQDGIDVRRTWSRTTDPETPTRTIEVEVALGEVVVVEP